jgi:hypothetical protein
MKNQLLLFAAIIALFATTISAQTDCSNTSTGNIPLNDLGEHTFMGYQGGLYPGGANVMPFDHSAAGNQIGKSIKPLNADGAVDWENGVVIFAAFGASTAGNTFGTFKKLVKQDTTGKYNPCLAFVDLTFGGKGLETMQPPGQHWYWYAMQDSVLAPAGFTREQVQIAWMKSGSKDDSIVEFPLQADSIYQKYVRAVIRLKDSFPNLKILYLTSHAYGGYAGEESNNVEIAGEPASYYGGFSVKWLIEDQINGDVTLKFSNPGAEAPWMAWAPYYWADGTTPRETDGLTWECSDYSLYGGGFHLSNEGKEKEANMLIQFLYNDASSKKWFRSANKWTNCDPSTRMASGQFPPISAASTPLVYPSPNNGIFTLRMRDDAGNAVIRIIDEKGQLVFSERLVQYANQHNIRLDNAHPGIYFVQVVYDTEQESATFVIQ